MFLDLNIRNKKAYSSRTGGVNEKIQGQIYYKNILYVKNALFIDFLWEVYLHL